MSKVKPKSQIPKVILPSVQTLIVRETHHVSSTGSDKKWLTINSADYNHVSLDKVLDRYLSSHKLITSFETVTTCGTIDITVIRVTTFVFSLCEHNKTESSQNTKEHT
jgi:hypothetical protein